MKLIHELISEQASTKPNHVALVYEEQEMSYKVLEEKSNQLANFLVKQGVGPEKVVGICMEKSFEAILSIVAIWKAGGAYVPLDPHYPKDRLDYMLEDTGAFLVLTQGQFKEFLQGCDATTVSVDDQWSEIEAHSSEAPKVELNPENLAYVLYTSGSTGNPKGAMILHRAFPNLTKGSLAEQLEIGEGTRVLQRSSMSFSVSVSEISIPLANGGVVVLAKHSDLMPGQNLSSTLKRHDIDVLMITPSALSIMTPEELKPVKVLSLGGENSLPFVVKKFLDATKIINIYGASEFIRVVTFVCTKDYDYGAVVPIGKPVSQISAYILDDDMKEVPDGEIGELCISGPSVARGYLNKPEQTAKSFVDNPFGDGVLFKTKDLVRKNPDGNIVYVGRKDFMIKIRGFRVEPGDIEHVMMETKLLDDAVVIADKPDADDQGPPRMSAYFVAKKDDVLADANIKTELKQSIHEHLPDYMMPAIFVMLNKMPKTPSGKLDRKGLPPVKFGPSTVGGKMTEKEEHIATIWKNILSLESIDKHSNFFEIGGDSIRMMSVLGQLSKASSVSISIEKFYEDPTIAAVAKLVGDVDFDVAQEKVDAAIETEAIDVVYEQLTRDAQADMEGAARCIAKSFVGIEIDGYKISEPLTEACGNTEEQQYEFLMAVLNQVVDDGLTFIAKNKETGEVVGAFICENFDPKAEPPSDIPENFTPIVSMLSDMEQRLAEVYEEKNGKPLQPGEFVHRFMVGVIAKAKKGNIAQQLTEMIEDEARKKGYVASFGEATNYHTQLLFKKRGYHEYHEDIFVEYKTSEYKLDGEYVFRNIDESKSKGCRLMYKAL